MNHSCGDCFICCLADSLSLAEPIHTSANEAKSWYCCRMHSMWHVDIVYINACHLRIFT